MAANLLHTLAGDELFGRLAGVELTRLQIFKEERKARVSLAAEKVVAGSDLDSLCENIKAGYSLFQVELDFRYKTCVLTEETVEPIYQNLVAVVTARFPAATAICC